jgi:hypothetical protein
MRRLAGFSLTAAMVMVLSLALATTAFAYPTKTVACTQCHDGANIAITATLASTAGTTATYNFSAPGADAVVVFDGATKIFTGAAASGQFTVTTGKTYTIYAVSGPGTSDGLGSKTISPVAGPAKPAAPVLNATYNTSANSVTISWAAVAGATSYDYQVGAGAVQSTSATSVTLNGLAVGATAFKLRAVNAGGASVYASANIVYTLPVVAPAAPVLNASYNTSTGSITISWAAVSGATSYDYQVGAGAVQSTSAKSVTLSGLAIGTTAFKLRATNSVGSSAYANANIVYAVPAPAAPAINPTYITTDGNLTISWIAVPGATGYEYTIAGGSPVAITDANVTLTGLPFGTTSFQVRAINSTGPSAYDSASIIYWDPSVIPNAPTLAPSYTAASGAITIQWPAVPGATSYEYNVAGGPVQTVDANSVSLAGLVYGTSTFRVCAVNAAGESAYTVASIVVAPPAAPVHAKIKSFTAKAGDNRVVTFKGRVSGLTKAGKATITVYIRKPNGKYAKYVYYVKTSATGAFSLRKKMPRTGRAYAAVTAYGARMKSKTFKIHNDD